MTQLGKVMVRWVRPNINVPTQVTVQFAVTVSRKDIPSDFFNSEARGNGNSNPLIAVAQNSVINENITFTALMPFNKDVAARIFGGTDVDFTGQNKLASEVFGREDVCINVCRSTVSNPYATSQAPVINPTTGDAITVNGKEIYQHTEVNVGKPTYTFLFDKLPAWIKEPVAANVIG